MNKPYFKLTTHLPEIIFQFSLTAPTDHVEIHPNLFIDLVNGHKGIVDIYNYSDIERDS